MDSIYNVLTESILSIRKEVDRAEEELAKAISEYIGEGQSLKSKRGLPFSIQWINMLAFEVYLEEGKIVIAYSEEEDGRTFPHATQSTKFGFLDLYDKVKFLETARVLFAELKPIKREFYGK